LRPAGRSKAPAHNTAREGASSVPRVPGITIIPFKFASSPQPEGRIMESLTFEVIENFKIAFMVIYIYLVLFYVAIFIRAISKGLDELCQD
jgi:hypothetical protein